MFRRLARALTLVATAVAITLTPAAAQARPLPEPDPASTYSEDYLRVERFQPEPRLVRVRYASHPRQGFDRFVFDFRGGVPDDFQARYVRRVFEDPSGRRVFLPGRAFLVLRFDSATARSVPRGTRYVDLDNVRAWRLVGDYEGVVRVALGLRQRTDFRLYELPGRVVLDVDTERYL